MRDADGDWAGAAIGAERRLLAVLRGCGRRPPVATAARALSFAGEHGAVWLAAGLTGAAMDRERRADWLRGTALIGAAHLVSMGVKRVVRRPRPGVERYAPLVRTAGRHSFPSSHATSAAAAAVALGALHPSGRRLLVPAAAAMCLSRLVVGVHYPTDVVAGVFLGAVTATAGHRWLGGAVPPVAAPRARAPRLRHARVAPGAVLRLGVSAVRVTRRRPDTGAAAPAGASPLPRAAAVGSRPAAPTTEKRSTDPVGAGEKRSAGPVVAGANRSAGPVVAMSASSAAPVVATAVSSAAPLGATAASSAAAVVATAASSAVPVGGLAQVLASPLSRWTP